uniref:alpha/beta hydrolase family protein n=1 Tax=Parerythrobacter lutipelagi TaxID=1964208 RepID=UPI0010FA3A84|nr:S9 family peptidase [Parerythrobacter lutipelagi]
MPGRTVLAALAALSTFVVSPVAAQDRQPSASDAPQLEPAPPLITTANFAARSELSMARVSPDGKQIAGLLDLEGIPTVVLFDAATRQPTGKFGTGEKYDIEWLRWAGNSKLLVSISESGDFYGDEVLYTRLLLVNLATLETHYLEPRGSRRRASVVDGDNVIHVDDAGRYALVSMQKAVNEYPSVLRFELNEDKSPSTVQHPRPGVWTWYADNTGVVRVGTGWYRNRLRVYYRANGDKDLELVAKFEEDDPIERFWDVAAIIGGSDQGYVLRSNDNGRVGLHLFDYAKGEIVETIYENPDWDLDSVSIRDGKPYAAYYTDDRERVVWFDEDRKRMQSMLDSAMKEEQVWISSSSEDGSRMLVYGGGENDPGALYVFSPNAKKLDQFAELRPGVDFRQLARPMGVTYQSRDGKDIRAYLTLPRGREAKGLPLIILPHGGPYGIRDKLEYNDEVQLLANRGYAVLQPNYRGSGGYGEAFMELGRGQIGRQMQDDLDDAMDWAIEQGIAAKDKVCVVGGSYGGYAALWAVIRNPERYRCAASWAGVTDFDSQLKYDRNFFTRKAGRRWRERVEGGADFDLDSISPASNAARLTRPILLAHGEDDSVVPFSQFKKMRGALEKTDADVEYLVIEDEGHSFTKWQNEKAWYDALLAFLAEHNPAK